MKNLFVPYHLAKLAKEKGFKAVCAGWWFGDGSTESPHLEWRQKCDGVIISAPLYQQLIDWFREEHRTTIWITPKYWYHICSPKKGIFDCLSGSCKENYYKTLTKALEEAFKLIK